MYKQLHRSNMSCVRYAKMERYVKLFLWLEGVITKIYQVFQMFEMGIVHVEASFVIYLNAIRKLIIV